MYERLLDLNNLLKKKSFFLFGPRASGKSFLIRQQLSRGCIILNLLDGLTYTTLCAKPYQIKQFLDAKPNIKTVIIDEIQRIPELLNEVHKLIEEDNYRFLLTGSSTRRLKQRGTNLLAGRAWEAHLFPLTTQEIPNFNLNRYLQIGGLPAVYGSKYPEEELSAYTHTYLQEEIQAEAFVRKIPAFSRFLQMAALNSGRMINFSNIASDTAIPISTVREYYKILEDTLLGFTLTAWQKSIKRKAITTAKFYLFDIGVRNTLANITALPKQSNLYGQAFEHFIAMELSAYLSYKRIRKPLSYWRSKHGFEVDFIIGDEIAIEVKSCEQISSKHLKNIRALMEENICKQYYIVSQDPIDKNINGIKIRYWRHFIDMLYAGDIISEC